MTAPGPPPSSSSVGTPAGLVSRGLALWIDTVIVAVLVAGAGAVTRSLADLLGISSETLEQADGPLLLLTGSAVIGFVYYTVGFAFFGRTGGKLLLGLRVVSIDGRNPSLWRSGLRTVGYVISSILFLGFLWAGVDRRHQAFHDKLARTFVVYAWDARPASTFVPTSDEPLLPQLLPAPDEPT